MLLVGESGTVSRLVPLRETPSPRLLIRRGQFGRKSEPSNFHANPTHIPPPPQMVVGRSTAGLMAGIVYGGDTQSIGTDH